MRADKSNPKTRENSVGSRGHMHSDSGRMADSADRFVSVDYEIYGNVQGVFFRQHTFDRARQVGAVGWVKNTFNGTVKGTVQGTRKQVADMRHFLSCVGSPSSTITKSEFTNDRELVNLEYKRFSVTA